VLVGTHDGAVDHRIFIVGVGSQNREDTGPYTSFGPTAPSAMDVVPIPETLGKVAPGDAGAVPMYHRIDEPAVVRRGHADGTRPPGQPVPDQVPLVVAELVGAHGINLLQVDTS
jgi:hypothetical protein